MKIKKIPSRKRIKVSYKISEKFGFKFYESALTRDKIEKNFGMLQTSKNWGHMYFRVVDQKKFMLFKIAYSEYIKN